MKKILSILFLLLVLFQSCSKDDDLLVTIVQNGNLSITLVDNNGSFLSEGQLTLFQGGAELDLLTTDVNGTADFGTLNVGNYTLLTEITIGNKDYKFSRGVQVVTGATKMYEINPEQYEGSIEVQFRSSIDGAPIELSGIDVLVVKSDNDVFSGANISELLPEAVAELSTDSNGSIDIQDIPIGSYYIIYHNNEVVINYDYETVFRDQTARSTFYVNALGLILDSKSNWSVASLVSTNSGATLSNNYLSISFDLSNNEVILTRGGGFPSVSGDFYFGSSYMDFYWDSMSNWYANVESVTANSIEIRYYDYDLGDEVLMTLQ